MSDHTSAALKVPATLNLRRLFLLRNFEVGAQLLAIVLAVYGLDMPLPLGPLLSVVVALVILNVLTWLRLRLPAFPVSLPEFFFQIVMDVLALTALLYFAGGSTNPFISLFLLPLVIVAATLPGSYAWAMAVLTIACYTLLMFFYNPLPRGEHPYIGEFDLHIFGMWFGFLLSVGLIIFFVMKMANALRERDRILAATREKTLHDEHLVALGTLAAGTAHELGTPLATMAVLAKEIEQEYAHTAGLSARARILRDQIDRCKRTLATISERAGQARAESGRGQTLDHYLEEVITEWRGMRPLAGANCRLHGIQPAPFIVVDKTLKQAFINILNNAADASLEQVEIEGDWNVEQLVFDICDRGDGFDPAAGELVGTPHYTTKEEGQGLGVFLARAVIGRFGGTVHHMQREGGGVRTRIVLPLARLAAPVPA